MPTAKSSSSTACKPGKRLCYYNNVDKRSKTMAENENCTHDCSSCGAACPSREAQSLIEPQNKLSHIKKVIGVVSGKGGVGKSLVTSMLAVEHEPPRLHRPRFSMPTSPAPRFRRCSGCTRRQRAMRTAFTRSKPRPASRSCPSTSCSTTRKRRSCGAAP